MTTTTKAQTIDIGEVSNAIELVFTQDQDDRRYILQPAGTTEDYLSTLERFPKQQIKRTSEYYIEDTDGQWFACYNVDCFDPPMAIVRARTFEDAYEVFCSEFERSLKVEESNAVDYPEDDREYNANGTHIDASQVQIQPLTLVSITCRAVTEG